MYGMAAGYMKSEKFEGFYSKVMDTVIGNARGKLVALRNRYPGEDIQEVKALLTAIQNKGYIIQMVAGTKAEENEPAFDQFRSSLSCKGQAVESRLEDLKAYRLGFFFRPMSCHPVDRCRHHLPLYAGVPSQTLSIVFKTKSPLFERASSILSTYQ